jgi:hypothetical protein
MPPVGFEPAIPASDRLQTLALDTYFRRVLFFNLQSLKEEAILYTAHSIRLKIILLFFRISRLRCFSPNKSAIKVKMSVEHWWHDVQRF